MFEYQLVGRLGLFVTFLVLANACVDGEIGDASGGARLGPEASDPEFSPLVCAGASPDVSAQNGWQSSEAPLPADGALRFELKARPTAANLDGLVAVGAEDIDDFAKAAIAVRFADNGLVDVRDGAFYSSDLVYPYDSGVWYSISISADIDAETYDVEIGPCGEPRKTLIDGASFRDNANVSGQLSAWAVWSSQAAALEISTPAWMDSEGCAPATCLSLGHACGTPQDGCGGTLSCGVCGEGEMCSSGTCIDAPANASPPPPPTGTPYGHVVPSDVGKTISVGVVAAVPTEIYEGPLTITADDTLIENVVINGGSECLKIEANNVTVRNVILTCNGAWGFNADTGNNIVFEYSYFDMQSQGKAVRISSPGGNGNNITIRNNEIKGGQDFIWMNETEGLLVENNYVHELFGGEESHGDGFQWSSQSVGGANMIFRGNYFDLRGTASANDILFVASASYNVIYMENNFFAPFGSFTLRCWSASGGYCVIRNNIYSNEFLSPPYDGSSGNFDAVDVRASALPNSIYSCNRYETGSFIPGSKVNGITHDITGCPSYP